jgi:hypothetical protein
MKKLFALIAILGLAVGVSFGQSLEGFQEAFEDFAANMAGSLALNSAIGSNWSDAYIGGFPHFGVGLSVGAAFTGADNADELFAAMGASLPSELESLGVPIPAAGATFKIGLPILPIDIGLKAGLIPQSVGDSIRSATGASIDYKNVGIQIRYAVLKQNIVMPNVSIGVAYNYQKASVIAPTGISGQSFTVETDQGSTNVSVSDPDLSLDWSSNTVDFTIQASKQFLFFIPYVGLGYTVGKSSVEGGLNATVGTDYAGGVDALNSYFAANGGPTISDQGFTYSADATDPVFRIYGGFSLRILIDLDTQVMYVPASKAFAASLTTRFQL